MNKTIGRKKIILAINLFVSVVAVLIGSIYVYAASLTTPTSLTYQVPPVHAAFQSYTASDCASMDTYTTVILTDTRDSKLYRIRKMPDGHCWMIDNLALSTNTMLADSNTNINADAGSDFVVKWNSLNSNGAPVQDLASHSNGVCTAASSISIADGSGELTCNGATYSDANDGFIAYSDPSQSENLTYDDCTQNRGININALTGCGYLYNWYTATAGSGNYQATANISSSICPLGWSLPKGNRIAAQNEFAILNSAMATGSVTPSIVSSAATRFNWRDKGPFEGVTSGLYFTSFDYSGTDGYYWTSSARSNNIAAYGFIFSDTGLTFDFSYTRSNGFAVRCVL